MSLPPISPQNPPQKSSFASKLEAYAGRFKLLINQVFAWLMPTRNNSAPALAFKATLLPVTVALSPIIALATAILAIANKQVSPQEPAPASASSARPSSLEGPAVSSPLVIALTSFEPQKITNRFDATQLGTAIEEYNKQAATREGMELKAQSASDACILTALGNDYHGPKKIQEDVPFFHTFKLHGQVVKIGGTCDGHGGDKGLEASKYIAKHFPQRMENALKSHTEDIDNGAMQQLASNILTTLQSEIENFDRSPFGTCFCGVVQIGNTLHTINVGDSLAFCKTPDGEVFQLTQEPTFENDQVFETYFKRCLKNTNNPYEVLNAYLAALASFIKTKDPIKSDTFYQIGDLVRLCFTNDPNLYEQDTQFFAYKTPYANEYQALYRAKQAGGDIKEAQEALKNKILGTLNLTSKENQPLFPSLSPFIKELMTKDNPYYKHHDRLMTLLSEPPSTQTPDSSRLRFDAEAKDGFRLTQANVLSHLGSKDIPLFLQVTSLKVPKGTQVLVTSDCVTKERTDKQVGQIFKAVDFKNQRAGLNSLLKACIGKAQPYRIEYMDNTSAVTFKT
jgi:serine/threonine protein phosphatase PrpC